MKQAENFGVWLRERMINCGLSQSALARRACVSQGLICKMLQGERKPGPTVLTALAQALEVPVLSVYRAAGYFPPAVDEMDPEIVALAERISVLSAEKRLLAKAVIEIICNWRE